jgi:hypothetical protein
MLPNRPNLFTLSLFLSLLLGSMPVLAGTGVRDTADCLEISGSVWVEGDSTDHISVELVLDNEVVEQLDVASFQPFKFYLKRDKHYTVKLSRHGFIGQAVTVDTELPGGMKVKSLYKFHFETELVKAPDKAAFTADALDYPIALVRFNTDKKKFEYSQKYNDMVNDLIDKDMYRIYGGDGEAPDRQKKPKKK